MVNVPELQRVLNFITERPQLHDQADWLVLEVDPENEPERFREVTYRGDAIQVLDPDEEWSCGTTACVAGWTALLAGWRPLAQDEFEVYRDGVVRSAPDVAAEVLGLDEDEAGPLFSPCMTRQGLWEYAAELTDGAIQPPPTDRAGERS